jgi:hypothetical protein
MRTIRSGFLSLLLSGVVAGVSRPVEAQDVSLLGVVKGISHQQSGPATLTLQPENPYQFSTFVELSAPGRVLNASLTPPGKSALPLGDDGDGWYLDAGFATAAARDAAFPNGNFTLRVIGQNDGLRTVVVPLAADAYPPIPQLNNFSSLQNVAPGEPLTLTWTPFTGGTLTDFVQLEINSSSNSDQVIFETSGPGEPGSLNGTQTTVTIPAGRLAAGQSYTARLMFAKIVALNATDYGQGVPAIGAFFQQTRFPISVVNSNDTEAPQLSHSSPPNWENSVPRNSGVAFQFNESMQPLQSIVWSGADPAQFTYRWSHDRRVLFCLYSPQLPAGATISWQLNRNGFKDLAGNSLGYDPQGTFSTETNNAVGLPDVAIAGLFKAEIFTQAPGASPQIRSEKGYAAGVFADSNGFNTIVAGSLRLPTGQVESLSYSQGDSFELETEVDTKVELEANAPLGTYELTLETVHQGSRTVMLPLPSDAYPSPPELLNLVAAQTFDPAQPLTLSWKPMVGGTVNDFIGLWVDSGNSGHSVFETPEFQSGQALKGTATSVTIPAGTMRPGRSYDVELEFGHPTTIDTTSLPGSTFVVAFTRLTQVQINAAGAVVPPRIQLTPSQAGHWHLRVTGDPGVNYVLEATPQLGGSWNAVGEFQIFGEAFTFDDWDPSGQRFYRVRERF